MKQSNTRIQGWYVMARTILMIVLLIMAINPAISAKIEKQPIILFPFAISSDIDAGRAEYTALYAEEISSLVNKGLSESKHFSVYEYNTRIANIQRAVREQKYTEKEAAEPIDTSFSGTMKAKKLAEIIGIGYAVTGSIDRYEYLDKKDEVQLTVTLQFIDVAGGKVKSAYTATGRAKKDPEAKNQNEMTIGISAAQDAANKLLADIDASKTEELVTIQAAAERNEEKTSGQKKKVLLPAMVLMGILGFVLGGG